MSSLPGKGSLDDRSDALIEQALTLIARRHDGDDSRADEARSALADWPARSPAHAEALAEAEACWAASGQTAQRLRDGARQPEVSRATRVRTRAASERSAVGVVLGILFLCALLGRWTWDWQQTRPQFEQQIETASRMLESPVILPDGSTLEVDADTRLSVRYSRSTREVQLERGRVRFEVAADARHPFIVRTRHGDVRVIGTAFTVSDRDDGVQVAVEHGRVRVQSARSTAELTADQAVRIAGNGLIGAIRANGTALSTEWLSGWLVFDDVALFEVLRRFAPYLDASVTLGEDAARLRLTGRFRGDQPEAFLATLPKILPVRVLPVDDAEVPTGWRVESR